MVKESLPHPADIQQEQPERPKGEETYHLESGVTVELKWSVFTPSKVESEESQGQGVIVMPGWGNTRLKTMESLSQSFAENAEAPAYLITTRSEERGKKDTGEIDFLYEEASAISEFAKKQGIHEITLAGHSQAASRMIDVASILQNDSDMQIRGVVLMGPVGLYEQHPAALAGRYVRHGSIGIPVDVMKASPEVRAIWKEGNVDASETFKEEIGRSGLGPEYWRRLMGEVAEMAQGNQHARELRVPIVVMVGADDTVANRERLVPAEEEKLVRIEMGEDPGLHNDRTARAREQIIKENFFPESPYVRMIVPTKLGNHLVQIFRPESVAKVSMYLLERYGRSIKN